MSQDPREAGLPPNLTMMEMARGLGRDHVRIVTITLESITIIMMTGRGNAATD
jgi:hypothetical protein